MENKNQIYKFLGWLILGIIICFIGLSRPKAWTTISACYESDLTNCGKYRALDDNGTLSQKTIGTNYSGVIIGFDFFSSLNTQINKTYKIRINFYGDDLKQNVNASMVDVSIYTSSWIDATLVGIQKQNPNGYSTWLDIYFTVPQASSKIWVTVDDSENGNAITGSLYYGISSIQYEVVDQNSDIMNNANQNANNIINNNNNNTQNIIDNDTSNTQAIIDNDNSNTQAIINSQYTCKSQKIEIDDYIDVEGAYLSASNTIVESGNFSVSNYIKIKKNSTYTLTLDYSSNNRYALYDAQLNLISNNIYNNSRTITFDSGNAEYVRFTIRTTPSSYTTTLKGNICLKDSEEQEKTSKGIFGKLKELITGLFDTSGPDTDGLSGMAGYLPPGPVDSILNLPLTFFNQLNSTLGGSCSPVEVTLPFVSTTLTLPCWSTYMSTYLTNFNTLWTFVGAVASVIILYRYLLALYVWVDDVLMLRYDMHEDFGGKSTNFGGV